MFYHVVKLEGNGPTELQGLLQGLHNDLRFQFSDLKYIC